MERSVCAGNRQVLRAVGRAWRQGRPMDPDTPATCYREGLGSTRRCLRACPKSCNTATGHLRRPRLRCRFSCGPDAHPWVL